MVAKFAIIIATYQRTNGKTPHYLEQLHQTITNQTYDDYYVILIGDDYTDNEEFERLAQLFPSNRCYYENNKDSYRSGVFSIARNKWTSGGALARSLGIRKAIEFGCSYYVHLDDDDTWSPNHLAELNSGIKNFGDVDFLYTRSLFMGGVLPREDIYHIDYNNLVPRPEKVVNSATCLNLATLGEKLLMLYQQRINQVAAIKAGEIVETLLLPFDMVKWRMLQELVADGDVKTLYIPKITCRKMSDVNIPSE